MFHDPRASFCTWDQSTKILLKRVFKNLTSTRMRGLNCWITQNRKFSSESQWFCDVWACVPPDEMVSHQNHRSPAVGVLQTERLPPSTQAEDSWTWLTGNQFAGPWLTELFEKLLTHNLWSQSGAPLTFYSPSGKLGAAERNQNVTRECCFDVCCRCRRTDRKLKLKGSGHVSVRNASKNTSHTRNQKAKIIISHFHFSNCYSEMWQFSKFKEKHLLWGKILLRSFALRTNMSQVLSDN